MEHVKQLIPHVKRLLPLMPSTPPPGCYVRLLLFVPVPLDQETFLLGMVPLTFSLF